VTIYFNIPFALLSDLCKGLENDPCPLGAGTETCMHVSSYPCYIMRPSNPSLFDYPNNILEQKLGNSSLCQFSVA
jgi:hypothetical protein